MNNIKKILLNFTLKNIAVTIILLIFLYFFLLFQYTPANKNFINLATTSSLYDSGLLPALANIFYEQTGIKVNIVVTGSGQAFVLAKNQDVDIIFTHSPDLEIEFVKQEYALKRYPILYNKFILVGPPNDPAHVGTSKDIVEAFQKIYLSKNFFVSRGDNSGTHIKEQWVWNKANLKPLNKSWYLNAGCTMAEALRLANEKQAYTLSDTATFLTYESNLNLQKLFDNDTRLINIYSIIELNPQKLPKIKYFPAKKFITFLHSPKALDFIQTYGAQHPRSSLFYLFSNQNIATFRLSYDY